MATTPGDLAPRVLRKLKVIGLYDTGEPEETQRAITAVGEAHQVLNTQRLVRWTLQDIPQEVEGAYVQMAAYLAADDFLQPKDAIWMAQGMAQVQAFVRLPATGPTYADDF